LGSLYASHFATRLPGARLHAVTDVRSDVTKAIAAQTGAKAYATYQELVNDKDLDAVIVMTPTKLHAEVVIAAAAAKKAVFCEKPLSLDVAEAAVLKNGIFFQLGFMRRFDRAYAAAKKKIEDGVIGTPIVFKSASRDQFPPPIEYLKPVNSGGLFIDMGIHDFDLARWYMGEVKSVFSCGGAVADPEIAKVGDVDNAFTSLNFTSGKIGSISLSRTGIYGYAINTEIVGTKGTIQIGYDQHTSIVLMTENSIAHDTVPGFLERFEQSYLTQLENFVANLIHGRPAPITCDDGIAAQKVALAATRSVHSGKLELV
jgi:predicted dehydrogenase